MWSLPDINRMNNEAASAKGNLEAALETGTLNGEKLECECKSWGREDCNGELYHYLWYDIFSNDPKGILSLCEHHDGYFGSPTEGYFTCSACEKVFIDNYTWELYYVLTDCEQLCLPCYAAEELTKDENWIQLTDEAINGLTFDRVRKAKHLIGVRMPVPKGIQEFGEGVTLDSSTGGKVVGFTTATHSTEPGVEDLKDTLREAKGEGHKRAILILDGGYQFAVSIGVYVDTETKKSQGSVGGNNGSHSISA